MTFTVIPPDFSLIRLAIPPPMVYHPPPTPPAVQVKVWAWAREAERRKRADKARKHIFFIEVLL
jgi:hypothetical protein